MLLIVSPVESGGGEGRTLAPPLRLRLVKLVSTGLRDALLPTPRAEFFFDFFFGMAENLLED
jgi:hypothetical protein